LFQNPSSNYRPFVRWWWTGDKIERPELLRELKLLKQAGISGVEINPIRFPSKTDDMGKSSVQWLSNEWIDLLQFTLKEAKNLGIICDLIVGSGWPFGAEWLQGEERSQIMTVAVKKIEGPYNQEFSIDDLLVDADPSISSPFAERTIEILSIHLVPEPVNSLEEMKDVTSQVKNGKLRLDLPAGKYGLYLLAKVNGFMSVIQGAPGATGPVLNHYNKEAVKKYLHKMSDTIQRRMGPLSGHVRSLFTDSLELEGANWCSDMREEFTKRRGYDLMPYLPFVLFRITRMGNIFFKEDPGYNVYQADSLVVPPIYDYGVKYGSVFNEIIQRVRYDFELTKAELLKERFHDPFLQWCKENKVQSRMQAYGRGYFPLDSSLDVDIPEGETWIRPGVGNKISEEDYRIGRAYTVTNKFVSSAAHLKGKKEISCEELTNIHLVFNESLELMKVAGDQSIISGMTHPVFHGFAYSPLAASFPGWVVYGTFINERNPWWTYFKLFTDYKSRLSALLQHATMFADIAVLPATTDLWSKYGAQNDPFPIVTYPDWHTLVWESIHHNGNACDYISEKIINESIITNGVLSYGPRKYRSIFLTQVDSVEPKTAKKLFEFVQTGGKIFFIETFPNKSPGWKNYEQRDKEVQQWIRKIQSFKDRCIFLNKPGKDHVAWFKTVQLKYKIAPYIKIDEPVKFVSQVRYQTKDAEIFVFSNANMNAGFSLTITPISAITLGKSAWTWDPETGERFPFALNKQSFSIDLGPSDLQLIIFDKNKNGVLYKPPIKYAATAIPMNSDWSVKGTHSNGNIITSVLPELTDLKGVAGWENFCGELVYASEFIADTHSEDFWIDLGRVYGVCELLINGISVGTKWYGSRKFNADKFFKSGKNRIEIKIVTTMGNYMKGLKDNPVAQFWTNEGRTIQPLQPIGLIGPVTITFRDAFTP
jgi:hypothetical protein